MAPPTKSIVSVNPFALLGDNEPDRSTSPPATSARESAALLSTSATLDPAIPECSPLVPATSLLALAANQSTIQADLERLFAPAHDARLAVPSFDGRVPPASGAVVPYRPPVTSNPTAPLTAGTRVAADGRRWKFEQWRREETVGKITQQFRQTTLSSAPPGYPTISQESRPAEFAYAAPMDLIPGLGSVPTNPSTASNPYGVVGQRGASAGIVTRDAHQDAPVAPGIRRRVFLAAPLRVIHAHSARDSFLRPIVQFLDKTFPAEKEEVVQRDTMIPAIIYMVAYEVSDEDWASYGNILGVFKLAGALNGILGEDDFDEMPKNEWLYQQKDAELEQLLLRLVQWMRLGTTYDVAKPWESQLGRTAPAPDPRNRR